MRIRELTRAAPWRVGLAAGALLAGLVAAPAIGQAALDGSGGQPPPGAPAVPSGPLEPVGTQPPAGAPAVPAGPVEPVAKQPVNPNPDLKGLPTQVTGPEKESANRPSPKRVLRAEKRAAKEAGATGGGKD